MGLEGFDREIASLVAWLAKLKSAETKAIRIERTAIKPDRKMAMLKRHEALYGEKDYIAAFHAEARANRAK